MGSLSEWAGLLVAMVTTCFQEAEGVNDQRNLVHGHSLRISLQ